MVVGHESVELQGVELEAGVVDVLHILHGVFVHGQQGGGLGDTQKRMSTGYIPSIVYSCCLYISKLLKMCNRWTLYHLYYHLTPYN